MSNRWFLLALFCTATAHAQQPPLVIRTDTRMVEMTVVVQDSKNQPVTGLTREDFTITDNKKPQVISIFESNNGENIRQPATGLPAGYFSNRLEYRGGVPSSVTALLIDLVNTPPGYWGRARPHLARFLNQSDPRLRLAIYVLNHGGLRVLHDFTTDTALLTKRLGAVGD
jgi:VWFA-related protein